MAEKVKLTPAAVSVLRQIVEAGTIEHVPLRGYRAPDGLMVDLPDGWIDHTPPTPTEPEPGAYLIGGRRCVRFAGDDSYGHWAVEGDGYNGYQWLPWSDVWARVGGPGVAIQRLVPESAPLAVDEANATLDDLEAAGPHAEVAERNARWAEGVRVRWRGRTTRTTSEAFVSHNEAVVLLSVTWLPVRLADLRVVDEHAAQEPVVAEQKPGGGAS